MLSDNYGSKFTATAVRTWLFRMDVGTLYSESSSPRENGVIERRNAALRIAEGGVLQVAARGSGADRKMAHRTQLLPAAQCAWLPTTGFLDIGAFVLGTAYL